MREFDAALIYIGALLLGLGLGYVMGEGDMKNKSSKSGKKKC